MPNTGPSEGSRSASMVSTPIAFIDSARPMEVTVLPSPSGVGVIAVTSMMLAVRPVLETLEQRHVVDLRLVAAVELEFFLEDARLLGDRPGWAASWQLWAISMSLGTGDLRTGFAVEVKASSLVAPQARDGAPRAWPGLLRHCATDCTGGCSWAPHGQRTARMSHQPRPKRSRAAACTPSWTARAGRPVAAATRRTSSYSGETVTRRPAS